MTEWLDLVKMKGQDEPVQVMFVARDGTDLIVRQVDPCDIDPQLVPMYEGDNLKVMGALYFADGVGRFGLAPSHRSAFSTGVTGGAPNAGHSLANALPSLLHVRVIA